MPLKQTHIKLNNNNNKLKTAQSVIRRSIRILIKTNKYHQNVSYLNRIYSLN